MELTIKNHHLCLTVETLGAQMMHLQSADGTEYLWQGDPRDWEDRAPTLFPFIARLTEDSYLYEGKRYFMGIHGFAAQSQFTPIRQQENLLVLELSDNEETRKQYPLAFRLQIAFELREKAVQISYLVENPGSRILPFGIGGHPGFRVPLTEGETFRDYALEFSCACQPDRVGFTPSLYLSGHDEAYPLLNQCTLPLKHELFDQDAIVFKNMAKEVTLRSGRSGRGVTVSYPDMPYLGLWHQPRTDAPYLCIEPWSSLPSRQDIVEELTCKSDLIQLKPGGSFHTSWTITIF